MLHLLIIIKIINSMKQNYFNISIAQQYWLTLISGLINVLFFYLKIIDNFHPHLPTHSPLTLWPIQVIDLILTNFCFLPYALCSMKHLFTDTLCSQKLICRHTKMTCHYVLQWVCPRKGFLHLPHPPVNKHGICVCVSNHVYVCI